MKTSDFDYELPPELVAQVPLEPRDASRLLVLDRHTGAMEHRRFHELGEYLRPGDLLVFNDSRVLRARLRGSWADTGGAVELLLVQSLGGGRWSVLLRPSRRARPGRRVVFACGTATVASIGAGGAGEVVLEDGFDPESIGEVPLPPYIRTSLQDDERYQTVYAREKGSVAAPTAGLHFTPGLLDDLRQHGVRLAFVTLHVGPGTFRPVVSEDPRLHRLGTECGLLPAETAGLVLETRARQGRVIAVGTTSCRLLEQWAMAGMPPQGWSGRAGLFILPGHRFAAVDALLTNFHLPRSTLLMLVSAFAGREPTLHAYREAVSLRYRFYSFGDAMLIL